MPVFSDANLFGMTIRESANDGSDFTNPDADYRRLFLGEDGALHLKDSAGTVTNIATGGGVSDGYGPKYDPDRPPTSGTAAVTDEFNDSSLHADWTWTTSPSATVSESQFPGFLHFDGGTNSTPNERILRRAYVPGGATAFSIASRCTMSIDNGNFSAGVGVAALDSSDNIIGGVKLFTDGTTSASDSRRILFGAGDPGTASGVMTGAMPQWVYLLMTRDASDVYKYYWSDNGIAWMYVGTNTSATAIAKLGILFRSDTDATLTETVIDFVRVFTSVTRKIGTIPA